MFQCLPSRSNVQFLLTSLYFALSWEHVPRLTKWEAIVISLVNSPLSGWSYVENGEFLCWPFIYLPTWLVSTWEWSLLSLVWSLSSILPCLDPEYLLVTCLDPEGLESGERLCHWFKLHQLLAIALLSTQHYMSTFANASTVGTRGSKTKASLLPGKFLQTWKVLIFYVNRIFSTNITHSHLVSLCYVLIFIRLKSKILKGQHVVTSLY